MKKVPRQDAIVPDASTRPTLEVEEAARILGLGRASAYIGVKNGDIPAIRVGKRLLVPTAALRRMLALDVESPAIEEPVHHA
ncbi:MAG: helix-turn-helix domain-containing protein [Actinomycetota bacterium]|nr:helix-turn-helix domain-containing protein [Actinomycetota bacterium]